MDQCPPADGASNLKPIHDLMDSAAQPRAAAEVDELHRAVGGHRLNVRANAAERGASTWELVGHYSNC